MRVLMVAQFFSPVVGGEERIVEDTAAELLRRGHEVAIATSRLNGLPVFEVQDGIRIHRIATTSARMSCLFSESRRRHVPPAPDPEAVLGLREVVRREQPDVVHAHNWLVHSYTPLKGWSGAPLLMSLHDYSYICATKRLMYRGRTPCVGPAPVKCLVCASDVYGAWKGAPTTIMNWMSTFAERRVVDLFLPVSESVALRSGLEVRGLPYRVLPNFLPERRPDADLPSHGSWLPAGDYTLFVGDLVAEKGIGVLLEAYAGLADAPPLVLIGRSDSLKPALSAPNTVALGPRPHAEVLEAWRRCAVAIVPSIWEEPFGMVALEAMEAGRPVVASSVGGLTDLVVHGESGLLVPPGDKAALRGAIARLLGDRSLADRMGVAAARRAAEFRAGSTIPKLVSAYDAVLAR
jgi:glycosyltransferase involved in cell wall biosynthesis